MIKLLIGLMIFISTTAFSQNAKLDIFGKEVVLDRSYTIKGPFRNGTVVFSSMPETPGESISIFYLLERKEEKNYCLLPESTVDQKLWYGVKEDGDVEGNFRKLVVCDDINILIVKLDDVFAKKIIDVFDLKYLGSESEGSPRNKYLK